MMKNNYPLEWLDRLILEHLNPNHADLSLLSEAELALISEQVLKESGRIQVRIKNEIFALRRKRQIRLQVRKYHSILIYLLDTMMDSQKSSVFQSALLQGTAEAVISCLDGLLSFLEKRFSVYLSLDERVPVTYLLVSAKELQLKMKKIKKRIVGREEVRQVLSAVLGELAGCISVQGRSRVTYRQLLYERTVVKDLEEMDYSDNSDDSDDSDDSDGQSLFSMLDHKLIELNFNSYSYISLLIKRIEAKVQMQEPLSQKLSLLHLCFKEFSQIHSNEKLFFNAGQHHLKTVMGNWFRHELEYLQSELAAVSGGRESAVADKVENKVECDLSADQIGIILRAADEARVVKSRSMSLVFQRIVPHLSTAFKRDLSYQSVRSKSYNAEENDKNIAILTLEKMIKKIRSY
ncbi:hypothetical protein SAMN02927916_3128 [Flavobacterium anhuiense]|uniref:Uncharacterized protein n=1 Tax=Flavobacterium anhuiense TaxID=459526 RepID=A0ABY0LWT6_9FLAO|nr:hypothetical protein [Flavobacterium anhuiense]SCY74090.1 hypothetical protein SAMN02927916_3128 [Flavobacterium anhuiense]